MRVITRKAIKDIEELNTQTIKEYNSRFIIREYTIQEK